MVIPRLHSDGTLANDTPYLWEGNVSLCSFLFESRGKWKRIIKEQKDDSKRTLWNHIKSHPGTRDRESLGCAGRRRLRKEYEFYDRDRDNDGQRKSNGTVNEFDGMDGIELPDNFILVPTNEA